MGNCLGRTRAESLGAAGGLSGEEAVGPSTPRSPEYHAGSNSKAAPSAMELYRARYDIPPIRDGDAFEVYKEEGPVPALGVHVHRGERVRDFCKVLLVEWKGSAASFEDLYRRFSLLMLGTRRSAYLANVVEFWFHTRCPPGLSRRQRSQWAEKVGRGELRGQARQLIVMTAPPGARNLHHALAQRSALVPRVAENMAHEIVRQVLRGLKSMHSASLPISRDEAAAFREKGVETWEESVSGIGQLSFRQAAFVLGTAEPSDVWVSGLRDPGETASGSLGIPPIIQAAIGGLETMMVVEDGKSPLADAPTPYLLPRDAKFAAPEVRAPEKPCTTKADVWAVGRLAALMLGAEEVADGVGDPVGGGGAGGEGAGGGEGDGEGAEGGLPASSGLRFPLEAKAAISKLAMDFVSRCLREDPQKRPSAERASAHPWVRGLSDEEAAGEYMHFAEEGDKGTIATAAGLGIAPPAPVARAPTGIGGSGLHVGDMFADAPPDEKEAAAIAQQTEAP